MHTNTNREWIASVKATLGAEMTAEDARKVTLEEFESMGVIQRSALRRADVKHYEELAAASMGNTYNQPKNRRY